VWNLKDKCIGILGLSFKPNTEDMREAPSIDIIKEFLQEGAKIKAYDPQAMKEAQKRIERIEYKKSPYEAVEEVDCICLLTEWEEFKALDWNKIYQLVKTPLIVDGRNVLNKKEMEKIGFRYVGIGK
jgi:UDPglucose 6-dehydrogenase